MTPTSTSTLTSRRQKVIAQVEKLMALSESSNEAEATLAAEKASALVIKFMISEEELKSPASRRAEKPIEVFIHYDHYELGFIRLLNRIAEVYGVVCIHDGSNGIKHGHSWAIGFKTELELVDRLFQRLHRVMWDEAQKSWKESPTRIKGSQKGRGAYMEGFFLGFANRVGERLKESVKQTFEEAGSSTDLVLVPRAEQAKSFARELHPNTREIRGRSADSFGYENGRKVGDKVSLHKGEVTK